MRKHKTIQIDDREVTIKELRIRDIIEIFSVDENTSLLDHANEIILRCVDGLTIEGFKDLSPSEINEFFEMFQEVNSSFFGWAQKLGLEEKAQTAWENLKKSLHDTIAIHFSDLPAGLSMQATPTP